MTIELPALAEGGHFTAEELRLELARMLYARGRIGKVAGWSGFFHVSKSLGRTPNFRLY